MTTSIPAGAPRAACSLALTLALAAAAAPARELSWRSIDVVATVAADGSLAVAETQALVMSGDWNGGERIFRVEPHQRVRVARIVRIDPATGAERVLERGDLGQVDHWDWSGSDTVRWRSRAPTDPPFLDTLLVYRLELVYERLFEPAGEGRYRLAHDFLFADRAGVVERFSVALDAAPGWQLDGELVGAGEERRGALPARFEAGPLPPASSYTVRGSLAWNGEGTPALAAPRPGSSALGRFAAGVVAAAALLCGALWWRRDAGLGRFGPRPEPGALDRAWLERVVFSERPEVIGAAWDRSVDGTEVAAILARLVAEGRMASTMRRKASGWFGRDQVELELELKVPRESFDDDERSLIAGLFPRGDKTDTETLRTHYKRSGFDPVSRIRSKLEHRVRSLAGFGGGAPRPPKLPTVLLLLAGSALLVAGTLFAGGEGAGLLVLPVMLVASIPGLIGALVGRARIGWPAGALVAIAISTLLLAGVVLFFGAAVDRTVPAAFGAALFAAGMVRLFLQIVSTSESTQSLLRRQELAAARNFFVAELARAEPRLEDAWFPWLVGLGLAPACDRWVKRFSVGSAVASSGSTFSGGGSSSSSSPVSGGGPGGGWSGGGGAFGGAGASASFAAAATTMAAGVASPSSGGSSSSGGGGGGSSSGGGGGGGW
jgi:hypothetical protein